MKPSRTVVAALMSCTLALAITGCSQQPEGPVFSDAQTKEVAGLASLTCRYHSVVKMHEDADPFIFNFIRAGERTLWFEYDATAKFGIDASKVAVSEPNANDEVVITLPEAALLGDNPVTIDGDKISDPIGEKGWFTDDFTKEMQSEALAKAQDEIRQKAEQDDGMKAKARLHAKEVLSQYVETVGSLIGKTYHVTFKDA